LQKVNGRRWQPWTTLKSDPPYTSSLKAPDSMKIAERPRFAAHKDKAEFATGLIIGAEEGKLASQMRKERYRQELLEQIAEQQRNKMREKELELRVAATGATDPEKKPDRIKQLGVANRQHEGWRRDVPDKLGIGVDGLGNDPNPRLKDDKPLVGTEENVPPGKSQVALPSLLQDDSSPLGQLTGKTVPRLGMGAAPGFPSPSFIIEDYHRNLSNAQGEVAAPRFNGIPLPILVTDTYKTPYDSAYNYYGARNPLDPTLHFYQNSPTGGGQHPGIFLNLPHMVPPPRTDECTGATDQHGASPLAVSVFPRERPKQTQEHKSSYQEALNQQIKENEEHKRRAREERERYDAKIKAEMMAYNPWGRSGGGAPIKDKGGNLIIDLKQMHRTNEEMYINPESFVARNHPTCGVEDRALSTQQLSGFIDQPIPQQLRPQNSHMDFLKQQIEEKRRKEAEEKERIRIEEEKEEKRLAEQRARIQQQYEEEQKRNKETMEKRLENQRRRYEHQQEEERRVREEWERGKKLLENRKEREERQTPVNNERALSPPIPTLQRRLGNHQVPRSPMAVNETPSRTGPRAPSPSVPTLQKKLGKHHVPRPPIVECSVQAPNSPPVPARRNQLQAKENQHQVMGKLSALLKYLQNEQRQLEGQLRQAAQEEMKTPSPTGCRRPSKVSPFDVVLQRTAQRSARRAQSGDGQVNMQNIREFNQLKYRDTASRSEVLHVYPEPPTDAQSLDIQQQALLRQQQRTIKNMLRREENDFLDQQLSHHLPRNKPAYKSQRDSELVSESAFVDLYSRDASKGLGSEKTSPQAPAEDGKSRTALQRTNDNGDIFIPAGQRGHDMQPHAPSVESGTSLSVEAKARAQSRDCSSRLDQPHGDHNCTSERLSGDEVDVFSLHSTPCGRERCVSAETVATEPWLRPGTSDAGNRQGCRERPSSGMDNALWLTQSLKLPP
ncbi:centrosome and spindle pole-associated protein 1, partial [Myripristis murdjan]|uniref:centrosome and spindle pole-associated protein 1 n=1 Tax=Myripristis murdjan TaxID=586833 RepID=UPI001175CECA